MKKVLTNNYALSNGKRVFDITVATFGIVATTPFFIFIPLMIRLSSKGPVFFTQERIGKNGKQFKIIKFRTMVENAETLKSKYVHLNHADGPVFKIKNDPRLTSFGKLLVKTGFDELPQLLNVLKGEMSIVGPRPFPVNEAKKLTKSQKVREIVLPGIVSEWTISGAHKLKFSKWMKMDENYLQNASFEKDLKILMLTFLMIMKLFAKKLKSLSQLSFV